MKTEIRALLPIITDLTVPVLTDRVRKMYLQPILRNLLKKPHSHPYCEQEPAWLLFNLLIHDQKERNRLCLIVLTAEVKLTIPCPSARTAVHS